MSRQPHHLARWAAKHDVTPEALAELLQLMGAGRDETTPMTSDAPTGSEAKVQTEIRIEASALGARLWRNNVGALPDERTGRLVRYGLCNESAAVNKRIKSSDLVGIRPVEITADMVGTTLGQFVAREVKREGWTYSGSAREVAQLRFIELVNSLGGDGAFANSVGTL